MKTLSVNDVVQVKTDNPVFHMALGYVEKVEEWGAHLRIPYWKPGNNQLAFTTYRAGWDEMNLIGRTAEVPRFTPTHSQVVAAPKMGAATVTIDSSRGESNGKASEILVAKAKGFTGEDCKRCGGFNMTRSGTCMKCEDCGDTNGGCG